MSQLFDPNAARRAVNVSLNSDMIARAREARLNLSAIAEEAIARALADATAKRFHAELARSIEEYESYLAEYGSLADAVRAMQDDG